MTVGRAPSQRQADRMAEFHRADNPQGELGQERRIVRVVKAPLWWEVRRYPLSTLLREAEEAKNVPF